MVDLCEQPEAEREDARRRTAMRTAASSDQPTASGGRDPGRVAAVTSDPSPRTLAGDRPDNVTGWARVRYRCARWQPARARQLSRSGSSALPRSRSGASPLEVDTRKAVAILAVLATDGRPYGREELAALLWPDADDASARGALRRTLSVLRGAVGPDVLRVDRQQVALVPSHYDVDVGRLETLGASGNPADLATAAELARGPFMAGFTLRDSPEFDDWRAARAASVERTVGRRAGSAHRGTRGERRPRGGDRGRRQADRPRPARRVGACPADGAPRRGRRSGRRGAPVPRVRRGPGARARGRPACRDDCSIRSHPRRAGAGGFAASRGCTPFGAGAGARPAAPAARRAGCDPARGRCHPAWHRERRSGRGARGRARDRQEPAGAGDRRRGASRGCRRPRHVRVRGGAADRVRPDRGCAGARAPRQPTRHAGSMRWGTGSWSSWPGSFRASLGPGRDGPPRRPTPPRSRRGCSPRSPTRSRLRLPVRRPASWWSTTSSGQTGARSRHWRTSSDASRAGRCSSC